MGRIPTHEFRLTTHETFIPHRLSGDDFSFLRAAGRPGRSFRTCGGNGCDRIGPDSDCVPHIYTAAFSNELTYERAHPDSNHPNGHCFKNLYVHYVCGCGTLINELPTAVSASEQADKSDNKTYVVLQNNTDQVVWFILDSPIYLEYRFSDSFGILLGNGDYHYRAYIGGKGPLEGKFHIGNQDKHTITFVNGKVIIQGP